MMFTCKRTSKIARHVEFSSASKFTALHILLYVCTLIERRTAASYNNLLKGKINKMCYIHLLDGYSSGVVVLCYNVFDFIVYECWIRHTEITSNMVVIYNNNNNN